MTESPIEDAITDDAITEGLRQWARGLYTTEAAAELIIRALHGKLLHGEWIKPRPGGYWFDATTAVAAGAGDYLSGGEHRLLRIAASLASDDVTLSLSETLPGLDTSQLKLVLAAVSHASGSHERSDLEFDDDGRPSHISETGALYPWPGDPS